MAKRSKVTWAFLAIAASIVAWAFLATNATHAPERAAPAEPSASSSLTPRADLVVDPASAALVGGADVGTEVSGGFRIVGITPVRDHRITIALERDHDVGMSVWIGHREPGERPPIVTARYTITFGDVRPAGRSVAESEQSAVAHAIEAKVRASEATAPPPPGL